MMKRIQPVWGYRWLYQRRSRCFAVAVAVPSVLSKDCVCIVMGIAWLCVATGIASMGGCASGDPFVDWTDHDLAREVAMFHDRDHDNKQDRHHDTQAKAKASNVRAWGPQRDVQKRDGDHVNDGMSVDVVAHVEHADVEGWVGQAMASNAEIRAARQRVERMRERVAQVIGLADPMVSLTFGDLAQTATGQVEYMVGVQQALPFPGTLDARAEVARQEILVAICELEATINRVSGDVRRTYWSYVGIGGEINILAKNKAFLQQIESVVNSRVRVGQSNQADLLRVGRELVALENRISTLQRRQRTAGAMLARLLGKPIPASSLEAIAHGADSDHDYESTLPFLDVDTLHTRADEHNARVKIAKAQAATYRYRLALAKRDRLPDFTVGLQYGAVDEDGVSPVSNGHDQVAGTIGITIPLWSGKYDAAEREAVRGMGEAVARVRMAQDQIAFEIDDALGRLDTHAKILQRLREQMMPDAQQIIDITLSAYRTGETDFLQLIEDWQVLLDDQLQAIQIVTELRRAMVDLRETVGDWHLAQEGM